jgi:hypothetical protein
VGLDKADMPFSLLWKEWGLNGLLSISGYRSYSIDMKKFRRMWEIIDKDG